MVFDALQEIYSTNTDVLALEAINILLALYLVYVALRVTLKAQKGSLAVTMRLLAYAFIAFLAHEIIGVVMHIPSIRWNLLQTFTETVFLAVFIYAIRQFKTTIDAYEYYIKKKK
ncbi:hypothetical protein HY992_03705 [Candidatus Micrarchaeota archaeon]|nr:hypothetical protein [Candidatus Micrarchaeota archaeon]